MAKDSLNLTFGLIQVYIGFDSVGEILRKRLDKNYAGSGGWGRDYPSRLLKIYIRLTHREYS
jgi:hypothetical protein